MKRLLPLVVGLFASAALSCRGTPPAPIGPGTVLTAHDEQGATLTLRIDAVEKDSKDADGDVFLYTASVRDPSDDSWKPFCLPDREGKTHAIPLQGTWDGARNHVPVDDVITFACTNGALAKCVRLGYKPWKTAYGVPLADYHQACVHLIPADYCGDGRAHTRNGTSIDIYDRLGIQKREPAPGIEFEAAWSPRGAVYLRKPRYGGETLEELTAQCPDRLHERTPASGPALEPGAVMDRWPEAVLFTESAVTTERP
jgi:hypothetical protein